MMSKRLASLQGSKENNDRIYGGALGVQILGAMVEENAKYKGLIMGRLDVARQGNGSREVSRFGLDDALGGGVVKSGFEAAGLSCDGKGRSEGGILF